jgi:hypothetical protein
MEGCYLVRNSGRLEGDSAVAGTLDFFCPKCSAHLTAKLEFARRKVKCPCGQILVVPSLNKAADRGITKPQPPESPEECLARARQTVHFAGIRLRTSRRRCRKLRRQAKFAGAAQVLSRIQAQVREVAEKAPLGRTGATLIAITLFTAIALVITVLAGPGGVCLGLAFLCFLVCILYAPDNQSLDSWRAALSEVRDRLHKAHREACFRVRDAENSYRSANVNAAVAKRSCKTKSDSVEQPVGAPDDVCDVPSGSPGEVPFAAKIAVASLLVSLLLAGAIVLVLWGNLRSTQEPVAQSPISTEADEGVMPTGSKNPDAEKTHSKPVVQSTHAPKPPRAITLTKQEVPVLSVRTRGGKTTGELQRIVLSFNRSVDDHTPLQVAVVEDTPGGSGKMLRSSIWLAALVAGLSRNDDLSGVTITVSVPGAVDGPSAGGVVCLAILSALDGRTLPKDFGFTGTILPDGTIGRVGKIAHKMKAAQAGGCRRVLVPHYLRFQKEPETNDEVDLKKTAATLGLEYVPVENIHQAYCAVHRLTFAAPQIDEKSATELPQSMEDVLTARIQQVMREADALAVQIPEEQQKKLDAYFQFTKYRDRARRAYSSDRLCYAYECALRYLSFLKARQEVIPILGNLNTKQVDECIVRCDASLLAAIASMSDDRVVTDGIAAKLPPEAAQLLTTSAVSKESIRLATSVLGDMLEADLAKARAAESSTPSVAASQFNQVYTLKLVQLVVALSRKCRRHEELRHIGTLGSAMLRCELVDADRPRSLARFYHATQQAVQQTFESDVIDSLSELFSVPRVNVHKTLVEADFEYLGAHSHTIAADKLFARYDEVAGEDKQDSFVDTLKVHLCAESIASTSGMIMRWSELGGQLNKDGKFSYERPEVLSYLLRNARNSALMHLAECHASGIPCPGAIASFQRADMLRDDPDEDKVTVLASYWSASLHAQALRMLFLPAKTPNTEAE